jgi:hypothetical protein
MAERRLLKPGTVLVREHGKVLHHVMVVKDGFSWNRMTYASIRAAKKPPVRRETAVAPCGSR